MLYNINIFLIFLQLKIKKLTESLQLYPVLWPPLKREVCFALQNSDGFPVNMMFIVEDM